MSTHIKVYVALCDVDLSSIVAWSEVTTSAADTYDNTTDSVRELFTSKHPVGNRLLILHAGYYTEYRKTGDAVELVGSVKAEHSEYRII